MATEGAATKSVQPVVDAQVGAIKAARNPARTALATASSAR
jgi:hypothetical protein